MESFYWIPNLNENVYDDSQDQGRWLHAPPPIPPLSYPPPETVENNKTPSVIIINISGEEDL